MKKTEKNNTKKGGDEDKLLRKNIWAAIGGYFSLTAIIIPIVFIAKGIPEMFPQYEKDIYILSGLIGPVIGLFFCLIGYVSHKRDRSVSSASLSSAVAANIIFMIFASMFFSITSVGKIAARAQGRLAECEKNLYSMGTSIELYKEDKGSYPVSLEELVGDKVNKSYIDVIPSCPAYGVSYGYEAGPDRFTLWCNEKISHHHTGTVSKDGCWPQYIPGSGVMLKP